MKSIIISFVLFSNFLFAQGTVSYKNLKPTPTAQQKMLRAVEKLDIEPLTEWLCPSQLLRGDREFGGNGPKIKCEAHIQIGRDSASLNLTVKLWAQETVQDWSTTEGTWTRQIYQAPLGSKITKILSDNTSRTQFISPKAGYQIFVPGADVAQAAYEFLGFTDIKSAVLKAYGFKPGDRSALSNLIAQYVDKGNTVVKVPSVEGGLVKFFYIVGDTGGDDISSDDNCNDDTRINKLEFFPVTIETYKTRL